MLSQLNKRSRDVFRQIVETYVATGDPVGSRTLSKRMAEQNIVSSISPATVRNAMSDLEDMGLLYSPHTSAGRLPTEYGLRLYVDGLLEMGSLTAEERKTIEAQSKVAGKTYSGILNEAITLLSGLSSCTALVVTPKADAPLRHIEFVPMSSGKALVILVTETGMVENRLVEVPPDLPASILSEAGNYLSARLCGHSLSEARKDIEDELSQHRHILNQLTAKVIKDGIAELAGSNNDNDGTVLIVRGQSKLLENIGSMAELERIRLLFAALETRSNAMKLLEAAEQGRGVQIFIGAQTELFGLSGCSMILSPYAKHDQNPVGAIGVIGPLSMNYGHIIPMVDYTSKVISGLL